MKILIVVASKHGSTQEIGATIADALGAAGHDVDVHPVVEGDATAVGELIGSGGGAEIDVTSFDAAVIGSAVYMGRWMGAARDFVAEHAGQLQAVPVWLFSSGPIGEEHPEGMGIPEHLDDLLAQTGAREHVVFAGRLDKGRLNLAERMAVRLVKAPEGDFRDWSAIRDWARGISAALEVRN